MNKRVHMRINFNQARRLVTYRYTLKEVIKQTHFHEKGYFTSKYCLLTIVLIAFIICKSVVKRIQFFNLHINQPIYEHVPD